MKDTTLAPIAEQVLEPTPPTFKDAAGRTRYMTPGHVQLVQTLVYEGCTVREAAKASGLSISSAYQALERQHVASYFEGLMEAKMRGASSQALQTQVQLLDSKEDSVRHHAAKDLMNRAGNGGGIGATGSAVNIQINLGQTHGTVSPQPVVVEGEVSVVSETV